MTPADQPFLTDDPMLLPFLCREWQGTRVVNIGHDRCEFNLMRPGPLGNPFPITRIRDRTTSLIAYRAHLLARPDLLALVPQLKGHVLGCVCDPLDCHCHVVIGILRDGLC